MAKQLYKSLCRKTKTFGFECKYIIKNAKSAILQKHFYFKNLLFQIQAICFSLYRPQLTATLKSKIRKLKIGYLIRVAINLLSLDLPF